MATMKLRWLLLLLLLLPILGGLFLVPSVRWSVYGWLKGEAFYRGMPTSRWVTVIEELYHPFPSDRPAFTPTLPTWVIDTQPSFTDRVRQQITPGKTTLAIDNTLGGALLDGDHDALPVLLALIHSNSAKARRVAVSGLVAHGKARPEIVQALLHATQDPDEDVRGDAKMALKEVAPDAAAKAGIK